MFSFTTGKAYKDLYTQVSLLLDQQVNNIVARELLTSKGPLDSTKTELLLDHMQEGAVSILKRWPEMKSKFKLCLNISIPRKLQSVAWTLHMSNVDGEL